MSDFDKKIKQMAKDETWQVPSEIDNNISNLLENIDKPKTIRKRPLKVVILVAAISVLTLTTAFAIENIIQYFNYNKDSEYASSKEELEAYGKLVDIISKDKGIEFRLENISVDNNYINIFYTIKGDKSIDEYYTDSYDSKRPEKAQYGNPWFDLEVNGKELETFIRVDDEAVYVSDYELRGMQRIDISSSNLTNSFEFKISTNEIFNQKGEWSVNLKIDKSKADDQTKVYTVNKDIIVKDKAYNFSGDVSVEATHYLNIEKVVISPFGNQIVINETVDADLSKVETVSPIDLFSYFALVDENNNYLETIGKGMVSYDSTAKGVTNSFEFKLKDKDIKSLKLVPIKYIGEENKMLKIKNIDKLPITYKMNEYSKVIIEDIKIKESEITYTYYVDGFEDAYIGLNFFDEKGREISFSCKASHYKNKDIGRITTTLDLKGYGNDLSEISKIKKVSTYNNTHMRLLYDEAIEINLRD